jgi:predicted phosphohydrolase
MIVQYCSDLHLEFPANAFFLKQKPIVPTGEILILAGDIVPFSEMHKHTEFFDYLSNNFKAVYWVPGNHCFYHSDMKNRIGSFREEIRDNIFLLNDSVEVIDNVRFVFSTLWSFIGSEAVYDIRRRLNDFRYITIDGKSFNVTMYNTLHRESMRFLSQVLREKADLKTVVVTHHVPTMQNYPLKYLGNSLNMAFATELKPFIEETQPDYWMFGHYHVNTPKFNIGKTVMLTNEVGYVQMQEHLTFDRGASFEV